jgi:predicted amidophosphoribosyltransferase
MVTEPNPVVCAACQTGRSAFDRACSYARYEGPIVRAIVTLKFEPIDPLAKWFAQRLTNIIGSELEVLAVDIVVPVPSHCHSEREPGTTRPT